MQRSDCINEKLPVLDARGMVCPLPLIRLQESVQQLKACERLIVYADDPGFSDDIEDWCLATGHRLCSLSKQDAGVSVVIEKSVHRQ